MSCAPDGQLYDPFGGAADLEAKRVRFVGDAEARIREDVLRLLRFFRFYAHYGAPPPDAQALAAVERLAPLLPSLSGERIAAETLKLLAARDPAAVLRLMQGHGVLAHFLPESVHLDRLARLTAIERSLSLKPEPPRRLAAVLESEAAARAVAASWHLSNSLRDRLVEALTPPAPTPALDEKARRALRYELTAEAFRDRSLLAWAGDESAQEESWRELVAIADWTPPRFPLRAQDAIVLGIAPGPALGELLREMERWWIEGDFHADRKACLAELKRRVGGAP
jgi:poly(A) polymerase